MLPPAGGTGRSVRGTVLRLESQVGRGGGVPLSKSSTPVGYQKRKNPKKSHRPMAGPGSQSQDHGRFRRPSRRWMVVGAAAVVAIGGLAVGLGFAFAGSSTPPTPTVTTTTAASTATTSTPTTAPGTSATTGTSSPGTLGTTGTTAAVGSLSTVPKTSSTTSAATPPTTTP